MDLVLSCSKWITPVAYSQELSTGWGAGEGLGWWPHFRKMGIWKRRGQGNLAALGDFAIFQ